MQGSQMIPLLEFGYTTLNTVTLSIDFVQEDVIGKRSYYGRRTLGLLLNIIALDKVKPFEKNRLGVIGWFI